MLVALALFLGVFAVFGQVGGHGFLHFDDDEYVYDNPHVSTGLTPGNLRWALTAFHSNNWHPVTWVSHMLDCQLFGLHAGPHHLVNVLLHALNGVLLFLLLRRSSGAHWRSALAAAIFALHPLRVESVAWLSDRKDVLSLFFGLVTLGCYGIYARRPSVSRYLPVLLSYALGLMAKPMLVTLPFLLLLIDVWPLRRLGTPRRARESGRRVWLEKLPLLALAAASSLLTLAAQSKGGVVRSWTELPLPMRVANALVSVVRYAVKLLLPVQQAFYYPYPRTLPALQALLALLLVVAVTVCVFRMRQRRPYLFVGWTWYLVALVPVIGFVQVATQAIADRYTYLPSIGFFVAAIWGVADVVEAYPRWRQPAIAAALVLLLVAAGKAAAQTRYWKDGITLFGRDVQVVTENPLGYRNLGVALADAGRHREALDAYRKVLVTFPQDGVTYFDIGTSQEKLGLLSEAADSYRRSLAIAPGKAEAHYNLGNVLKHLGRTEEALEEFRATVRLRPDFALAFNNLGNTLSALKRWDEAIAAYRQAQVLSPSSAAAYNNLGTTLRSAGRDDEALEQYRHALSLDPGFAAAEFNTGLVDLDRRDTVEAWRHFDRAVQLDPSLAGNLGPLRH